jgi:hypothetical protein
MVIIRTRAVATIIHAVSAALMPEFAANAGVAEKTARTGAASFAARHESAPIDIFPTQVNCCSLIPAPLPGAIDVLRD